MSERSENSVMTTQARRVTLKQVALATGLGCTTVSDILNRNAAGKYSAETCAIVRKAVLDMGYAPAGAAQQLARGRSGQIGLFLTRDFSNPFFARVADRVEREVRQQGYRLQIVISTGSLESELQRIMQMKSDAVEGLIVGPVYEQLDIEQHRSVFRGGLPMVLFGGPFESEFDHVALDHDLAWKLRIKHLVEAGHRRIGVLCLPPSRETPEQPNLNHTGLRLMKKAGCLLPEWVQWQADTGLFEDFYAACLRFAKQWKRASQAERPTAVICLNDQVAMTAIAAFSAEGIRVPADISVVGYDNLPESAYFVPALTTVDNNVGQQIETCIEILADRIVNPGRERVAKTIRPTLVQRASTKKVG